LIEEDICLYAMIKALARPGVFSCTLKPFYLCKLVRHCNSLQASSIIIAPLEHRQILRISGKDSIDLLQGLLTNDVTKLNDKQCMFSMMLNTQGRVEHDFLLYKEVGEDADSVSVLLECEHTMAERVAQLLKRYKLRKKVSIDDKTDLKVWQAMSKEPPEDAMKLVSNTFINGMCFADPRAHVLGCRIVAKTLAVPSDWVGVADDYHQLRYEVGVPEGEKDLPLGKCLPLESNLDYLNGVSFDKGCYLGQELTARTYHTGVTRKRLVPISFSASHQLKPGDKLISQDGEIAGRLRSLHACHGLALLKLKYLSQILYHPSDCHLHITPKTPSWWHVD